MKYRSKKIKLKIINFSLLSNFINLLEWNTIKLNIYSQMKTVSQRVINCL